MKTFYGAVIAIVLSFSVFALLAANTITEERNRVKDLQEEIDFLIERVEDLQEEADRLSKE